MLNNFILLLSLFIKALSSMVIVLVSNLLRVICFQFSYFNCIFFFIAHVFHYYCNTSLLVEYVANDFIKNNLIWDILLTQQGTLNNTRAYRLTDDAKDREVALCSSIKIDCSRMYAHNVDFTLQLFFCTTAHLFYRQSSIVNLNSLYQDIFYVFQFDFYKKFYC